MPTDKAGLIGRFADKILASLVPYKDTPNTFTKAQTFSGTIVETPLAADPATPVEGQRWARSGMGLRLFLGGVARTLLDSSMLATTAEARAGTVTGKPVDPAGVAGAIDALTPKRGASFVAQNLATHTTNSTDPVTIPGTSFSITPANANAKVEIVLSYTYARGANGSDGVLELVRDDTTVLHVGTINGTATPRALRIFDAPGAGAHNYRLQQRLNSSVAAANSVTVSELSARDIN